MNKNNPAERLHALLVHGKIINGAAVCGEVWKDLLKTQNDALLFQRLGKVMSLPEEIEEAVREHLKKPIAGAAYWQAKVSAAFKGQVLTDSWNSFFRHIDDHTISYLENTADFLNRHVPIGPDEKSLDEWKERLSELIKEVRASEQPQEVKEYIVRSLMKIRNAIDEYFLTGALPILEQVEKTVGHASMHSATFAPFLRDTELGRSIMESLGVMASIMTVAASFPGLSGVADMILSIPK